ncbi:MAG: TRAP transporter small permease [Pseudomonadota bacterium]
MTPIDWHHRLCRVNRGVGLTCGVVLLLACAVILVEIVTRRIAFGILGGTDELSGYVMAAVASWSAGFALIERAHIRIDLVHRRLPALARAGLDLLALAALLTVSIVILVYGGRVLGKSISAGSTANTPLETPLWIPQTIWLAGWVWFALASLALLVLAAWAMARGEWADAAEIAGPEGDDIPEAAEAAGIRG